MTSKATSPLSSYTREIAGTHASGKATEHSYRPALKSLVEALDPGVTATNEPKREACGAPDYVVSRRRPHGLVTIGHIETKEPATPLDEVEDSEQLRRYLAALDNLILTDYLEFRWYVSGEYRLSARLARLRGTRLVAESDGAEAVEELLRAYLAHRPEPIQRPKELAERMARLTHLIRDVVVTAFDAGAASDMLRSLRAAFADVLLPDLTVPDFADMYAQTLSYGLFAARCNHSGGQPFQRLGAAAEIPKTNPFLRKLFATITGPDLDDEPYVGLVDDLAQLLAEADMESVLADFGRRTRQEDPVVHFYETFLSAYDPELRETRGVYYTPEPVVSYIVRSVEQLLRSRFRCAEGVGDTSEITYGVVHERGETREERTPRVLVLDPACGTGTFLYAIVDLIRDEYRRQGEAGKWSGYVHDHLLPRLFGFELLMAPYAVAHLKLGMQLAGQDLPQRERSVWAFDFRGDERLQIYLTNSLEEAIKKSELLIGRYISEEANAAVRVKRELPILVVLGNPPYSGHSANRSWISVKRQRGKRQVLVRKKTFIGQLLDQYYEVDGRPLDERNPKWLQDDYVKFIRFGQWRIERTGAGILAFITNHGYLENPTFRGMRQQLMNAFTHVYLLDLHGSTKKRERTPDGRADENVFDIQQGVAIGIFVKEPDGAGPAQVHHADLWGSRDEKYGWLLENSSETTPWKRLDPQSPFYLFVPRDVDLLGEYQTGWKVTDIFPVHSVGIVTARDDLTVAWSPDELWTRIKDFISLPPDSAREKYELGRDVVDWKVEWAQKDIQESGPTRKRIIPLLYRPFDVRFTYYTGRSRGFICRPRGEVMQHMLAGANVGLATTRSVEIGRGYEHVFCSRSVIQHHTVSLKEVNYLFPLYVYASEHEDQNELWDRQNRRPNLASEFVVELTSRLGLKFLDDGGGDLRKTFGPDDVLGYLYAVLHSPTYRVRYREFLNVDFPRVPVTDDLELFRELSRRGRELIALHLLESPKLRKAGVPFPVAGRNVVEVGHPVYVGPGEAEPGTDRPLGEGRVYISSNKAREGTLGQYFDGVPPDVWDFHVGGYQVCERWLKDRRGRALSFDDLTHYQKIITAVAETIRIMDEIDEAIPSWPLV